VTTEGGYPKTFRWQSGGGAPATGPMLGQPCWADDPTWVEEIMDLDAYVGQSIQIQFRFGSDAGTANEGWYVDDVSIVAIGTCSAVEVTNLVILLEGDDLHLSWDADDNCAYRIYSDDDPEGTFTTLIGVTTCTEFVVAGRATSTDKEFYTVRGWDGVY
jgi:hypothetical protein